MKCKQCGKECELIYMIKFLAKDVSTRENNKAYEVLCYSLDGRGREIFKDVEPCNLHTNAEALAKIEKCADVVQKFNVYMDAIVERVNGYFLIRDTTIKID